jgi:hypothetical protein
MLYVSTPANLPDYAEFAAWLIAMILVAFGFRYAKDIIAFVLDKLYQVFILNNPA